jgi:hypothetical protein
MARKAPEIEIKEIGNAEVTDSLNAEKSTRALIAYDMAELIKSFIAQGKLEIKDGQIVPRKTE